MPVAEATRLAQMVTAEGLRLMHMAWEVEQVLHRLRHAEVGASGIQHRIIQSKDVLLADLDKAVAPLLSELEARQSKYMSFVEASANSVSGFLIGWLCNLYILPPLLGVAVSSNQAWVITAIFTALSIARSYVVRRIFNWRP